MSSKLISEKSKRGRSDRGNVDSALSNPPPGFGWAVRIAFGVSFAFRQPCVICKTAATAAPPNFFLKKINPLLHPAALRYGR